MPSTATNKVYFNHGRVKKDFFTALLKRAKVQLENVNAHVIGIVLNGVKTEYTSDYKEYKYSQYYYGISEEDDANLHGVRKIKKIMGDLAGRFM